MKTSAIRDIFNGKRGNIENMINPNMPPYTEQNRLYEQLKQTISAEAFALHESLIDSLDEGWLEQIDFYFTEGFKLGLCIGIECAET
ncbi:MAG: hypothetical protein FWH03_05095 [Firmicutes bacterium]|nr:hypothetical protein [Bacillota bacterium]